MTLPHPNLIPQQLKSDISSLYARRLTLVRTLPSCSDIPGGRALRRFFVFLLGLPSSRVAGTDSKYGSCSVSETRAVVMMQTHLRTKCILDALPQDLLANVFCCHGSHDCCRNLCKSQGVELCRDSARGCGAKNRFVRARAA